MRTGTAVDELDPDHYHSPWSDVGTDGGTFKNHVKVVR
jgi:hypothetical protein